MNFIDSLKSFFTNKTKPTRQQNRRAVSAGVLDAGSPVHHLSAYWAEAQDDYSDKMADAATRSLIRARARKEATNNGYAANAIRTFGNHVIGKHGPQLRILPEAGLTRAEAKKIEFQFWQWQRRTKDAEKLQRAVRALMYDGEAFQRFIFDPTIELSELNIQEIEAKRVDNPYGTDNPNQIEGIVFDGINPVIYFIQKRTINPLYAEYQEYEEVPADEVMHLAARTFPEQKRGLPIMATVLRLMADQQLYEAYTLEAAKAAAKTPMYMYTDVDEIATPEYGALPAANPGEINVLAAGWKPFATEVRYPTATYSDYDNTLTQKQGAGVGTPLGMIQANTSGYNYSSWRGEKQNYWVNIGVYQEAVITYLMEPRFEKWIQCFAAQTDKVESARIAERLLEKWDPWAVPTCWRFEQPPSVDPEKDRKADQIALALGLTSIHQICARDGTDYDDLLGELEQERKDFPQAQTVAAAGAGVESLLAGLQEDFEQEKKDAENI